jgi:hypothetical protein
MTSNSTCARWYTRWRQHFPTAGLNSGLWVSTELARRPILSKAWSLDGQRPVAPVEHRFAWRYLIGCVHPASGRTVSHVATSVSTTLFETELEAFAAEAGAGPGKQIVLVQDPGRVAREHPAAGAGAHPSAVPAASVLAGTAAGRTPVVTDEHGACQSPFHLHPRTWKTHKRHAAWRCKHSPPSSAQQRSSRGGHAVPRVGMAHSSASMHQWRQGKSSNWPMKRIGSLSCPGRWFRASPILQQPLQTRCYSGTISGFHTISHR